MYISLALSICFFLLSFYFETKIFVILSALFSGIYWTYFWLYFINQKKNSENLTFSLDSDFLASASERKHDDCEREQKK